MRTNENFHPTSAAPPPAAAIWRAARHAERDTGPARAYLASRGVWPPWRPLPPAVRFLAAGAAPAALALPHGAAGAIVFAWTAGAGRDARIAALGLEALTDEGRPLAPPRLPPRTGGGRRFYLEADGGSFGVPGPDGPGYPLHLTAGPLDALAVSTWRGRRAWAAGGSAGLRDPALARALAAAGREVVMEPPPDPAGRAASAELAARLQRLRVRTRIAWLPEGMGPAEALAADWAEGAAMLQYQHGMDRRDAEAAAWSVCPPGSLSGRTGGAGR